MKKLKSYIILLITANVMILTACKSTQNSAEKERNWQILKTLVEEREFEAEHIWLFPLAGNQVSIIDNPNYIRIYKDSVDIFLPYYGVRRIGGGYQDAGIHYSGKPKDWTMEIDEKKREIEILFEGKHKNENFNFRMTLYPSKTVRTSVQSSHRDYIGYQGRIKQLDSIALE